MSAVQLVAFLFVLLFLFFEGVAMSLTSGFTKKGEPEMLENFGETGVRREEFVSGEGVLNPGDLPGTRAEMKVEMLVKLEKTLGGRINIRDAQMDIIGQWEEETNPSIDELERERKVYMQLQREAGMLYDQKMMEAQNRWEEAKAVYLKRGERMMSSRVQMMSCPKYSAGSSLRTSASDSGPSWPARSARRSSSAQSPRRRSCSKTRPTAPRAPPRRTARPAPRPRSATRPPTASAPRADAP